jgi:hypothetical protein
MRQKALALLSSFSYIGRPVKIINNHRKLGGSLATLRDCYWHKEEPWGVVQFPSGKKAAIPFTSMDIPSEAFPVLMRSPQIDAMRLLGLAMFCQQLPALKKRKRRRTTPRKQK